MYFDIRDIAWAATGGNDVSNAWLPGGCSTQQAPSNAQPQSFICTGYPDIAGVAGSVTPVLERYRVNSGTTGSTTSGATIGLFFTVTGDYPIGGFTRRYFTEGDAVVPNFSADTPIDTLFKNSDGSLHLASFGGATNAGSNPIGPPYFATTAFRRQDHGGTYTTVGNPGGNYTAVKLP